MKGEDYRALLVGYSVGGAGVCFGIFADAVLANGRGFGVGIFLGFAALGVAAALALWSRES